MSAAGLGDRWRTPEGQAMAEEAVARLGSGSSLNGIGLGSYEGRVDLRELSVPVPARLRRFESQGWFVEVLGDLVVFRGARLEGLDLSGAQLQSLRFFGSLIADCRLERANCKDWRLWDTEVRDSSFVRANLRDAAVGTWHEGRRNKWRRVDFSRADFRVGTCWEAVYEDCDFSDAKIKGINFSQCAFTRCRFAGAIREVLFDGRDLSPERPAPPQMSKVDFRSAVFRDVDFRGFDMKDVTLPDDPDVRLLRRARCVARRGIQMLDGDDRISARMLRADLENRLRGPGGDQEASVFNRRDYEQSGGTDLVALAEDILGRAESACLR
jgi:uncharacterized protein YjbI with pentapeptide repeats